MRIRHQAALAFCCAPLISLAQLTAGPRHSRLVVPDHLEAVVTSSELIVDTLIMDKKSTLRFTQPFTRVVVRYARIGKKCKWTGTGFGSDSPNGKSLDIEIYFKELGSLTVDVRGGMGYRGTRGYDGSPGMNGSVSGANGSQGGNGGRGGDGHPGGNVTFKYRTLGEPIVFSNGKTNAVLIRVDGGAGGPGGPGGQGGPGGIPTQRSYSANGKQIVEWNGERGQPGRTGNRGDSGDKGPPGILKIVALD